MNYADDFVILSRGRATEALDWTRKVMPRIGLTLNETKSSIRKARTENFDFLGYTFAPQYWWKTGRRFLAVGPSKKSLKRLRANIYELLRPHDTRPWEQVRAHLNAKLRGWQSYFSYGAVARPYATVNRYVYDRVRHFLRRRHTTTHSRGTRQFFRRGCLWKVGCAFAAATMKSQRVHVKKSVGKPDAGDLHVRFDERGTETGRAASSAPAPFLDSTG